MFSSLEGEKKEVTRVKPEPNSLNEDLAFRMLYYTVVEFNLP